MVHLHHVLGCVGLAMSSYVRISRGKVSAGNVSYCSGRAGLYADLFRSESTDLTKERINRGHMPPDIFFIFFGH